MGKVLSIEITDVCTRLCEMSMGKKVPVIYRSLVFDNPRDAVEDGYIRNSEAYGEVLMKELKEHRIKTRNVIFTMTSNKIVNREVVLPEMKPEKIMALIESESAQYFPMDTTDHRFSYFVLERLKETKQLKLMVYAAPKELVTSYRILAAEQGMRIVRLDCSGNSISRWLTRPECAELEMYLQINERNSVFTITRNATMALQRNMAFGLDSVDLAHVSDRMLRPLVTNIANVLEYYQNKNREADMSVIYVGGIGSGIPGLKEIIEKEFVGIEVRILGGIPGVRIHKNNSLGEAYVTSYMASYGATISSINFNFNEEHRKLGKTLIRCVFGEIVVVAACVMIIMNSRDAYREVVRERNRLKKELEALEAVGIEDIEYAYIASDEAAAEIEGMHRSTETVNEHWNEILALLESEGVSNMVVSYVGSDESGLSMNITVGSKQEAAKLIQQLKRIEYFKSVKTSEISETGGETLARKKVVSFSVICSYTDEEAEPEDPERKSNSLLDTVKNGIANKVTEGLTDALTDGINSAMSGMK